MYNRYIRNDQGRYTRVPEEDGQPQAPPPEPHGPPPPPGGAPAGSGPPPGGAPHGGGGPPPPRRDPADVINQALRRLLDRVHLENVDTGDLLLLALLFLLFKEDADEELLFALGLLLIL